MIIGVERTTDRRYPETRIERFRSEAQARRWLAQGGGYAWPGAANEALPAYRQNWHHRQRMAYAMPPGYRLPKGTADEQYLDVWRNHAREVSREAPRP